MKQKQRVLDKLDEMDNHLVSTWQAIQIAGVTKETIERYLTQVRAKLIEVTETIKLEN